MIVFVQDLGCFNESFFHLLCAAVYSVERPPVEDAPQAVESYAECYTGNNHDFQSAYASQGVFQRGEVQNLESFWKILRSISQ
jgi:hypothetical protein